jgi:signal transduction histidine kinase
VAIDRFGLGECLFLLTFLMEIALSEAFILNLAIAGTVLAAGITILLLNLDSRGIIGLSGGALSIGLPLVATGVLVSTMTALMTYHRERSINQDERIDQLQKVVARLSASSLSYQHYAEDAASRSQMEERLRITRELHDIIGYTFTNNIMMLEAAITRIRRDPDRVQQLIDLARENAASGLEKIRNSLYVLRTTGQPRVMFRERLSRLIEIVRIATGMRVDLDIGHLPPAMTELEGEFVHCFIQEALTNAFLHGGADRVEVRTFRDQGRLFLTVSDNGSGATAVAEGIGLSGMRERLKALGGTLHYQNTPIGFDIMAEIPAANPNDEVNLE